MHAFPLPHVDPLECLTSVKLKLLATAVCDIPDSAYDHIRHALAHTQDAAQAIQDERNRNNHHTATTR